MNERLFARSENEKVSLGNPVVLLSLAIIAIVAYLPILNFPFISDDFVQIPLARQYGTVAAWTQLAHNPGMRWRSTYVFLSYGLDHIFGFHPLPFYVASVLLHVLCVWLVFGLGVWDVIGWRISAIAAGFFAIYEGHQEAVMWVAASMELLLFLFGISCLLLWILWLRQPRWWLYSGALAAFFLALFSKESSWIFVALMLVPVIVSPVNWKRGILGLLPFGVTGLAYVYWIARGQATNARFSDGSFSLNSPCLMTLAHSYWRLLFIWGLLSLAALIYWKAREFKTLSLVAMIWMPLSLLPYCFLTYMTHVPSRHTYLASVGLSWIVAAAILKTWEKAPKWLCVLVMCLIVLENVGILWTKKRAQFLERAAPTQKIMEISREAQGPLYLHCFPYASIVAEQAAKLGGHAVIVDPNFVAGNNCLSVTYTDKQGNIRTYTSRK